MEVKENLGKGRVKKGRRGMEGRGGRGVKGVVE